MKKWYRGLLRMMGYESEATEDDEPMSEYEPPVVDEQTSFYGRGGRGALVSIPGSRSFKVVLIEPRSFDEAQSIADHLKNRRPVILVLEHVDKELAQRLLNFLGGTIYALNGQLQRIAGGVFFLAPSNVELISARREERWEGKALAWLTPGTNKLEQEKQKR